MTVRKGNLMSVRDDIKLLDATIRDGGLCNNFEFIEKYMLMLREEGVVWGYDLQYMFTGFLNRHPREAIDFTSKDRKDYSEFYKSLLENY